MPQIKLGDHVMWTDVTSKIPYDRDGIVCTMSTDGNTLFIKQTGSKRRYITKKANEVQLVELVML